MAKPKHLKHAVFTDSLTILYTTPPGKVVIPSWRMTNTGGASTIRLYAVPPGGVPETANVVLYNHLIQANESFGESSGVVLEAGWTLQGSASQTNTIGMTLTGLELDA